MPGTLFGGRSTVRVSCADRLDRSGHHGHRPRAVTRRRRLLGGFALKTDDYRVGELALINAPGGVTRLRRGLRLFRTRRPSPARGRTRSVQSRTTSTTAAPRALERGERRLCGQIVSGCRWGAKRRRGWGSATRLAP
ncbi:hypothetical protein CHELA17_61431 [Chelatococcus asaccharovorans]|nr:hypothetical protein CHELA17_61431 [Chelatococcus asaccharovorans]